MYVRNFFWTSKVLIENHLIWATLYLDGELCTHRFLARKVP